MTAVSHLGFFPLLHFLHNQWRNFVKTLHMDSSQSLVSKKMIQVCRLISQPRWLSRMHVWLVIRSRVRSPPGLAMFFPRDWSWNIFYNHSLHSADSKRAIVSLWPYGHHRSQGFPYTNTVTILLLHLPRDHSSDFFLNLSRMFPKWSSCAHSNWFWSVNKYGHCHGFFYYSISFLTRGEILSKLFIWIPVNP